MRNIALSTLVREMMPCATEVSRVTSGKAVNLLSSSGVVQDVVIQKDVLGNEIIPGSVFGGIHDIRFKTLDSGKHVIEIVDYIMCVTGKSRNDAGETWRNMSDDVKKLIQEGLETSEGIDLFCLVHSQCLFITLRNVPEKIWSMFF
jgi:hypothetical protein